MPLVFNVIGSVCLNSASQDVDYFPAHISDGSQMLSFLTDPSRRGDSTAEDCEDCWLLGLALALRLFVGFRSTHQEVRPQFASGEKTGSGVRL